MRTLSQDGTGDLNEIVKEIIASRSKNERQFFAYVSLFLVTAISPVTYLKPAYADEPPYGIPDDETVKGMQVAAVWLPTTTLLYLACVDYIQTRARNTVPTQLSHILEGLSPIETRRQDFGIGILSLLSAIPLTTPLVEYPLISSDDDKLNRVGNGFLVAAILISNGVAHLRPLQIIIYNPWYGAPLTLARFFLNKFEQHYWSNDQKTQHRLNVSRETRYAKSKASLINALLAKKTALINDCFMFTVNCPWELGYRIILSDDFKNIANLQDETLVTTLINYVSPSAPLVPHPQAKPSKCYSPGIQISGQMVGFLALGECLGYFADSGFTLSNLVGDSAIGWCFAVVPIWTFGVLVHNAARAQAEEGLDFVLQFLQRKRTLSWQIKYCAKTFFGGLLAPLAWCSLLTAASANTMIRADFKNYWSESSITTYIDIFRWGFALLCVFLLINGQKYLFGKWAKYLGSNEASQLVEFEEKIDDVANKLSLWKGERMQNWLAAQPENLLNDIQVEVSQKIEDTEDPDEAAHPGQSWCNWLSQLFTWPKTQSHIQSKKEGEHTGQNETLAI